MRALSLLVLLPLAACGGSETTTGAEDRVISFQDFGVTGGVEGSNDLAFATGADGVTALGGATFKARVIRITRDVDTDEVRVVRSEETITPDSDYFTAYSKDVNFTLAGQDWTTGTDDDNLHAVFLQTFLPENVAEVKVYDLNTGGDEILHYGYTVFGSETDPAMMPGGSGSVDYTGTMKMTGFPVIDDRDTPSEYKKNFFLTISLSHDLDANTVGGSFEGFYTYGGGLSRVPMEGIIDPGAVTGNGYASTFQIVSCEGVTACSGQGQMGGVFYDADAGILAGLVQGDVKIEGINVYLDVLETHELETVGYFWAEK